MKILIINEHVKDKLGGSEIQCDLIARMLTEFGHEVIYLAVKGSGSGYDASYPIIPVRLEDQSTLEQAVIHTDPDVVYWRYNKKWFTESVKTLKRYHIPIIFSVSHNNDIRAYRTDLLTPSGSLKNTLRNWRDFIVKYREHSGFQLVDAVSNQCRMFMGKIDVKREIYFPNSVVNDAIQFKWNRPYCLWASRIKEIKQPEAYINLARQLQHENVDFLMVGEIQDERYRYIEDPINLPDNLHYLGVKSYKEVNGMIDGSLFLIHTCFPEGLPNNFLQAWALGKPVVSLHYDPDKIIESKRTGVYSRTLENFSRDVKTLIHDSEKRLELGENAKSLSRNLFNPEKNIKKLELLMAELVKERKQKCAKKPCFE